jgi:hypothetical protein
MHWRKDERARPRAIGAVQAAIRPAQVSVGAQARLSDVAPRVG